MSERRTLLVRDGEINDGIGAPRPQADVRVRDGVIVENAEDLLRLGEEVHDASGAVVAPGFIDAHTHTDRGTRWSPVACSGESRRLQSV